jgi:hypothetical protein
MSKQFKPGDRVSYRGTYQGKAHDGFEIVQGDDGFLKAWHSNHMHLVTKRKKCACAENRLMLELAHKAVNPPYQILESGEVRRMNLIHPLDLKPLFDAWDFTDCYRPWVVPPLKRFSDEMERLRKKWGGK